MKNRMADVRNHLVAQLEALGDKDADALAVAKAKAASDVAGTYVQTVKVELQAREFMAREGLEADEALPEVLQRPALPHDA